MYFNPALNSLNYRPNWRLVSKTGGPLPSGGDDGPPWWVFWLTVIVIFGIVFLWYWTALQ